MQFNVMNRWSGEVQFTAEIDCADDASHSAKLGLAVRWAIKSGADLSRANLSGADLSGADLSGTKNIPSEGLRAFKADLWMTLAQHRAEVPGLIQALRDGRADGSTYEGECACLVGTIGNIKGVSIMALDHGANRPAERWFAMIRVGDKPGDEGGGGFAAKQALEWALEWCALSGVEVEQPEPVAA